VSSVGKGENKVSDYQTKLLCSAIRYLGLCMVRSAVTMAMKPMNSQELILQTVKEYSDWIDDHSPTEAE
jgi:hypothetical protein